MTLFDYQLKALDLAHWELGEAFTDLPDEDVWRRPDHRLLSIGELAAHMAYGEAKYFLGAGFESPLIADQVRYYPYSVDERFTAAMSAVEVHSELKRIHELCKIAFLSGPREFDELNPNREEWTWGYTLEYMAFHVAYHTGQIYSVRHLMGHETVDN